MSEDTGLLLQSPPGQMTLTLHITHPDGREEVVVLKQKEWAEEPETIEEVNDGDNPFSSSP